MEPFTLVARWFGPSGTGIFSATLKVAVLMPIIDPSFATYHAIRGGSYVVVSQKGKLTREATDDVAKSTRTSDPPSE